MASMGSSIFLETSSTIEGLGVMSRRGAGKSWKAVKKVSKMKIGKQSIRFIGMKTIIIDLGKSLVIEDNYFSFKELLTDCPLNISKALIKAIPNLKGSKINVFISGFKHEARNIVSSIDARFDYDTEVYHQISELEKSLESLGVL